MSTLQVATIKSASSAAPVFQNSSGVDSGVLAQGYIKFSMTNDSIATSKRVSSITDIDDGKFRITLDSAFPNANYIVVANGGEESTSSTANSAAEIRDQNAGDFMIYTEDVDAGFTDRENVYAVFYEA